MRKLVFPVLLFALLFSCFPTLATELLAEESEGGSHLGAELPLWSVIPFLGILLSIAVFPLVAEKFWHHHFGKVSAFWAALFGVPFLIAYKSDALHEILHTYLLEYIPFIILLWALYTVAGGILVKGAPVGLPRNNLVLLIIGSALASWIGTTGAAMVLIRPLIRMNQYRHSKTHLVVFFIFLVANIGGSLTPLGDPPLFLGFLQGVDFFWAFNIFPQMLFVAVILLALFFVWDSYMFRKEGWHRQMHLKDSGFVQPETQTTTASEKAVPAGNPTSQPAEKAPGMAFDGLFNVLFLVGIIGGVLFSGKVHLGETTILGIHMKIENIVRDGFLVLMGLLSLKLTPRAYREGNEFTWFPIKEVAKLFAGIFITIIPALAMLRAGESGQLKFVIDAVKQPAHYFWITGTLSSFLDNAPTYLVFFNTALGKFGETVQWLMADGAIYLKAISAGAVFFGAATYIGNAPNFMVRSIAEENKINMPSFFGFMIYSVCILAPIFLLVTLVFF